MAEKTQLTGLCRFERGEPLDRQVSRTDQPGCKVDLKRLNNLAEKQLWAAGERSALGQREPAALRDLITFSVMSCLGLM
jgi:hypothetical protein